MKLFKKIVSVLFSIIVIGWISLIVFDFVRCGQKDENGEVQKPLIVVKKNVYNYDDGNATEYMSLGYKYVEYNRVSYISYEFGPFWLKIKS